ncbi:MAG TPA: STAS domain-containing protein [Solirubrobacteraceae bacterium]|jgi:anti-anti-sigma factor|nr:STAS domain-containing protein [Solirubrobacteraceae bacterium]
MELAGDPIALRPHFSIECLRTAAATILCVTGEVDIATAPRLAEGIRRCRDAGASVIVDLEGVEFMDASGLNVLVSATQSFEAGAFSVTPGSPQVQRLFEITGSNTLLHIVSPAAPAGRNAA